MATRRAAAKGEAAGRSAPARAAKAAALSAPARGLRPALREFRDDVVLERTGRSKDDWFALLDAFGAGQKGHTAAAAHLVTEHDLSPWWAQSITVQYERARGLRAVGERADGFGLSVQRALAVSAQRAWQAFATSREMTAWRGARQTQQFREGGRWRSATGDRGAFRRIVEARYLRLTWERGRGAHPTVVEVEFLQRGADRSTLKVTHRRLASAEQRDEMRAHWSWALDSVKSWLETGEAVAREEWAARREAEKA